MSSEPSRRWLAVLSAGLVSSACGAGWVDPDLAAERFFRIAGPVESGATAPSGELAAAVVWVWEAEGERLGRVQRVGLEPRVLSYVLDVPPPPDAADATVREAGLQETVDGVALILGLPILVERPEGAEGPLGLEARLGGLSAWVDGTSRDPADLVAPTSGSGERVVAFTADHLVIGSWTEPPADLLMDSEHFARLPSGEALQDVWSGLTLYRRDERTGFRWEPLAAPGQRSEFQGISMVPPGG